MSGGLPLLLLSLASCVPPARPMVSEVLYDAAGDDEGFEFVELHNPLGTPAAIGGLRLESGDGAGPGRWALRWTAPAGTVIAPGARYVVGGARVVPAPDATAELGLQNGPDAVRFVWPDGVIEVVGYGTLALGEYACGAAAVDAASGQSIARVPDGADRGANALDFRAATPSPGRANQPRRHVAWAPGTLAIEPEIAPPGAPVRVSGVAVNAGADSIAPGALALTAGVRVANGIDVRGATVIPDAIAPGESLRVEVAAVAPAAGVVTWIARLDLAGDESPEAGRDSLRVRVGAGPLALTEIQFHPARGEGEWIEVENRTDSTLDLAGFVLRDRGGTHGSAKVPRPCPPGALALLAQDPAALLLAYPRLDTARVAAVTPWPSLNNTNAADGIADVVELGDAESLPSDRVAYSAAGVPAGVPVERSNDDRWRAAADPAGTPLESPRVPPAIGGAFAVLTPRPAWGTTSVRIAWALPWPSALVRIDAYDLSGARIASLLPETDVAGRGESTLGVGPLGPGLAVLVLRADSPARDARITASQVVRVPGGPR